MTQERSKETGGFVLQVISHDGDRRIASGAPAESQVPLPSEAQRGRDAGDMVSLPQRHPRGSRGGGGSPSVVTARMTRRAGPCVYDSLRTPILMIHYACFPVWPFGTSDPI
jgi:hypothetical protein